MSLAARVFDCPACHAPLPPAADGEHVTCAFCSAATTIDYSGADLIREQASRAAAEALFATLGRPPSLTQKAALLITNKWLWIIGLPFMVSLFIWLGQIPEGWVQRIYESRAHVRLMHVVSPVSAWILGTMWPAGLLIAVLIWSLFGARVDARRDLQAALASKPPASEGGPALCRHCDAPLEFPAGALGARCEHCGADNLVQVPAEWAASARKIDTSLRLNADVAVKRQREGRRRVIRAASWRVPLVLALAVLIGVPAYLRRSNARWSDLRALTPPHPVLLASTAIHGGGHKLRSIALCDDDNGRRAARKDAVIAAGDSSWTDDFKQPQVVTMFPLAHGEKLRLVWASPGTALVQVSLAPADYNNGNLVFAELFGDKIAEAEPPAGAPGATAVEVPIATSGWYRLLLRAPAPQVSLEACLVPAPR